MHIYHICTHLNPKIVGTIWKFKRTDISPFIIAIMNNSGIIKHCTSTTNFIPFEGFQI
jgi:hypothetical protein